jgi:hypothetical protein
MTIQGPGADVIAIDGSRAYRPFTVTGSGISVALSGLEIKNGSDTADNLGGGGLLVSSGTVTVTNCSMTSDSGSNGGAIENNGTLAVIGSTISTCSATTNGGAVDSNGQVSLTNCTLYGNTAVNGGALNNAGTGTVTNCTFTANAGSNFDGALCNQSGSVTITNSILYGETGANAGEIRLIDGSVSATNCDIQGGVPAAVTDNVGNISSDPLFATGNLANNGGSTQTVALQPTSPCYKAGTATGAPATDQRGYVRPTDPSIGSLDTAASLSLPQFSPAPGSVPYGQAVTITSEQPAASIYFTSDGTTPTKASSKYTAAIPVMSSVTLKAMASAAGYTDSGTASGTYSVVSPLIVTNTSDTTTQGSLRAAITYANAHAGSTVTFLDGLSGTITLTSALPQITTAMTIQGPGATLIKIDGGGVYRAFYVTASGLTTISGLTVKNCTVSSTGGAALYSGGGATTVSACAFVGNIATSYAYGAAIYNTTSNSLVVTSCSFSQNTGYYGSAISISGSSTVTNCTFAQNTASGGGTICNNGSMTAKNCTFSGNSAGYGGAIYGYASATVTNCIFWGDTSSIVAGEIYPTYPTVTYSDIQGGYTGTGNINVDPLLGPLGDNGGTTPTMALGAASPCFGSGTATGAPTTDQRGVTRPAPPSIGAFDAWILPPPAMTPAPGYYSTTQTVTLKEPVAAAAIYFTTDGSTPTAASTRYTTPLSIPATTTVKAMAIASGYADSQIATGLYAIVSPTPVISPNGGYIYSGQSATVTITDSAAGAQIFYSTDGSTPTVSSTLYSGPITVSTTKTIKAIALAPGYPASVVASAAFTVYTPAPSISVASGTIGAGTLVSITDVLATVQIYYTVDGSTPTANSTLYTGPISILAAQTIKAIAVVTGFPASAVTSATYTVTTPTPTISPASGTVPLGQPITISDSLPGATIYYTTNGTGPTTASPVYSGPIAITQSTNVMAIAVGPGLSASAMASVGYTASVPAPVISPNGGPIQLGQQITITESLAGATIYYTTNGATPTTASTVYTGPITLSGASNVVAMATATNLANSTATSAAFTTTLTAPTISPASRGFWPSLTVTLSSATSGAAIYYTVDGSTPTTSSTLYTAPITVTSSTILKAITTAAGYTDSPSASATYIIGSDSTSSLIVTNTGDSNAIGSGSLRSAINAANALPGSTISFAAGLTGTIMLTSNLPTITASTTITGPGSSVLAIDGAGQYRPFRIATTGTSRIRGLTIQHGSDRTDMGGGAGILATGGSLEVIQCHVTANTSSSSGGGLAASMTSCLIAGSTFSANTAMAGGAISAGGLGLSVTNCTLNGNVGRIYGGAIQASQVIMTNSTCTGNTAMSGSAIYLTSSGSFLNTILYGDIGSSEIYSMFGSYTSTNCDIQGGTVSAGNINADPLLGPLTDNGGQTPTMALGGGSPCYGAGSSSGMPVDQRDITRPNPPSIGAYDAPVVAVPTISPNGGSLTSGQTVTVTITDCVAGAAIYYTVDGSTPTASSTPYTVPFTVSASQTIKAMATLAGYGDSGVAAAIFTVATPAPVITPGTSTIFSGKSASVSMTCPLAGTSIYYTTDGSTPTSSSTLYNGPITITTTTVLKAVATFAGYSDSSVTSATFTVFTPAPFLSPSSGNLTAGQSTTVTMTNNDSASSMYYTTDGSTPSSSSTLYTGPTTINVNTTIKAVSIVPGFPDSTVTSGVFTFRAPVPTITPSGQSIISGGSTTVTISDTLSPVSIYYTTDGTTPTTASTLYTGPFVISTTQTINAIAVPSISAYSQSAAATAYFTVYTPIPEISPYGGSFSGVPTVTVSITDSLYGTSIYYTTDGTTPSSSSTLYTGPFTITRTATVKAMATFAGYPDSGIITAPFTLTTPAPSISPVSGAFLVGQITPVTITKGLAATSVFYTTDGTTPTASSTPYTGPFTVTPTCVVKAIAVLEGCADSTVVTASYYTFVPTPVISPNGGGIDGGHTIPVTILDSLASATIYYTIDGTTPTASSVLYTGPIAVAPGKTVKAVAISGTAPASGIATATFTVKASAPSISPVGGLYPSTQTVTVGGQPGATFYYTTNGAIPTTSSTIYTAPINVTTTQTIKAIATASGYSVSDPASATYIISPTMPSPVFSPAGGLMASGQTVAITDYSPTASIYYTTDGSTPTSASTLYTGPITLTSSVTINAIACGNGFADSPVVSATYTVTTPAPTPAITPNGGTVPYLQSVTLTDSLGGASIYYTTDGSTPTTSSTKYSSAFTLSTNCTVKAIAAASGYLNSAVGSAAFTLITPIPTLSPGSRASNPGLPVTISDSVPGAAIYYTVDGSTPTVASTRYTTAVIMNKTTTLKAIAVGPGFEPSAVATAVYSICAPAPVIAPSGGTVPYKQLITMTDSAEGATIYYTIDGNVPTTSSPKYTAPFELLASCKMIANAIAPGYIGSLATTVNFTVTPQPKTPTPVISPNGGYFTSAQTVTITDALAGASIYYTTDGSIPTTSSKLYTGPFQVIGKKSVYAIATASGYAESELATAFFVIPVTAIVTNTSDSGELGSGSLRAAMIACSGNPGSKVLFQEGLTGTITLTSVLPQIISSLTILGPGADVIVVDGANQYRPFSIYAPGMAISISGLSIKNGHGPGGNGGGIVVSSGNLSLDHCTIANNSTPGDGGGLCNRGSATITNCTFSSNSAVDGGGIYNDSPSISIINSTFYGNTATTCGGAVGINHGPASLVNCTMTSNTAKVAGGAVWMEYDQVDLKNCIAFGDGSPQGPEIWLGVGNGGTATATYSDISGGYPGIGNIDVDPQLGPLQDNGGSTLTVALGPTSPCRHAATTSGAPERDQRGVYRTSPPSMGAYQDLDNVPTPTISPNGGRITGSKSVTIADTLYDARIYYTTDSTDPTESSTLYTGPFTVTAPTNVKAIGVATGYTNSAIATAVFDLPVPAPVISPNGGNFSNTQTVTIMDDEPTAVIYFTTDGSTPTSSSTRYTGPILLTATTTITACAISPGSPASAVASARFVYLYPVPAITSVTPNSTQVGAGACTINVTGTGFSSVSRVQVAYNNIATVYNADGTLSATIPASMTASAGPKAITVSNPTPGGGYSNAVTFTVENVVPELTKLNVTSAIAGAASTTISLLGTGLIAGVSEVMFGDIPLATTTNSGGYWFAYIPASALANPGIVQVALRNPAPGGGTSGSLPFTINNPVPALTVLSPTAVNAGVETTITVTGSKYNVTSVVYAGTTPLATTFVSTTSLTAIVPASLAGGTYAITVKNPAPIGGSSVAISLTLNNQVPSIASITPPSIVAGTATTIAVAGSNFLATSKVYAGATALVTKLNDDGTLTATVPASLAGGVCSVTVVNPAPGGGTSNTATLTVAYPAPTISKLNVTSAVAGSASSTISVVGTGFVTGASQVLFGDLPLTATSNSSGYWFAVVPASALANPGTVHVALRNPAPGGGTSTALPFTINNPVPGLTAISISVAQAGVETTITVTGSKYNPTSVVYAGTTPLATTFVSVTSLTASIPASLSAGTYAVTVKNPAPGGGASAALTLTLNNPVPTITSITPPTTVAGTLSSIVVSGVNLLATSRVYAGATALVTLRNSDGTLTANVPATLAGGIYSVTVVNPAPSGGTSNAATLTVAYPAPTITKLNTTSVLVGSGAYPLTIMGTGYVAGASQVMFGDLPVNATTNTAGAWVALIPPSALATARTVQVSLRNPTPGGGTSASLPFAVTNPLPILTAITPTTASAGVATTITATGSKYNSTSVVYAGDTALATTFVSATSLTAILPASLAGATYSVTVRNPAPGGGNSSSIKLTLNNPAPVIASITPSSLSAGTAATMTVVGTGLVSTSKVYVDSIALATVLNADGTLSATVPASIAGRLYSVTVVNPAPGGGTSNPVAFAVDTPMPVLTKLNVTSAVAGSAASTLSVVGTGFVAGASQVMFGDLPLPATTNSSGYWFATIPASALLNPGVVQVALRNPTPGGGTSGSLPFTINNPVPALTAISPTGANAGVETTIKLTGSKYNATSVAYAGTIPLATTFVSTTSLTAIIPAGLAGGAYAITVRNPVPGGGASTAISFTLNNAVPSITSITPATSVAGTATAMGVSGTKFLPTSRVYAGTSALVTKLNDDGTLTATVPASLIGGIYSVTVVNPAPGGGASNAAILTVAYPAPTITKLSTTSVLAGSGTCGLTITATGYVAGASQVMFGDLAINATSSTAGTWTAIVPASTLTVAKTVQVTVRNPAPGGGSSASIAFTIANPVPVLSAVTPTTTIAGVETSITVTGSKYNSTSVVYAGSTPLATTFVSTTSLTAVLPASLASGQYSIAVKNPAPGGGASSVIKVTVN